MKSIKDQEKMEKTNLPCNFEHYIACENDFP